MICVSYKNPKIKNQIEKYYDTDNVDVKAPLEIIHGNKVYIKYGVSNVSCIYRKIMKKKKKEL